jgi:Holliday junction DNA helicase RuvA
MYEFIRGTITELNPTRVIIEAGGVGYSIIISLNTFSKLNGRNETILLVHQIVREDAHLLYGFAEKSERELFRNLIVVNGVGANTAIMMLSSLTPEEIISAIATENVPVLKKIKGIGIKTAQRIIIDLKDRVAKTGITGQIFITPDNTILNEALSALVMLGFSKKDAEKAVEAVLSEYPGASVESLVKQALKRL